MGRKRRFGIVSYNMYGNFTNYGSALQTYALNTVINRLDPPYLESIVIDYCPDILLNKDILNPMDNMWDTDAVSRERCQLSLPAIRINYEKFKKFYKSRYNLSTKRYTSDNFNESFDVEKLTGYVCGSDTIFAVPEFGFDNGYYANYQAMRGRSVAYAASFGDYDIPKDHLPRLKSLLGNFSSIALREKDKIPTVQSLFNKPLYKVIDPTLLLAAEEYDNIIELPKNKGPYLLLYSRRSNPSMDEFAMRYALENGLEIIEISLNAKNADKHTVRYDAGIEEFLGLVKNAEMVVTNSFHGMIFAVQFSRPFFIFSRKLCDIKIQEVLNMFGIEGRLISDAQVPDSVAIEYDKVHSRIATERRKSIEVLKTMLNI